MDTKKGKFLVSHMVKQLQRHLRKQAITIWREKHFDKCVFVKFNWL